MTNLAIVMSHEVTALIGARAVEQFDAGEGVPLAVQCWACGGGVRVIGGRPGSVSLSILAGERPGGLGRLSVTVWSHTGCAPSKVVSYDEFRASPAAHIPSPVPSEQPLILVEPPEDTAPLPDLVTPRCPTCDQLPAMVMAGGEQAFCGNDACDTWVWNAMKTRQELAECEVGEVDISGLAAIFAPQEDR